MSFEYRTLLPAELAVPSLIHPDMVVLPEVDGTAHTRVLHAGIRFRVFRHEGRGDQRIIDLRAGHVAAANEDAIVLSMGAEGLRGLARRLTEIAREIDGQGDGPRPAFGRRSA